MQRKHAYYDEGFKGTNYDFVAMVFETSGAVNLQGLDVHSVCFETRGSAAEFGICGSNLGSYRVFYPVLCSTRHFESFVF